MMRTGHIGAWYSVFIDFVSFRQGNFRCPLQREDTVIAGVIYNPANDELYTAERGKGAFLNDQRIRVAGRRKLGDCVIACGAAYRARRS